MEIVILPIDVLKPHEKGSPLYLELLMQEIMRDGFLRHPIIADRNTFVILDGMHRWLALKSLGYNLIPTILVDVFQNTGIHVGRKRIDRFANRPDQEITVKDVISAGMEERLMQPRSTRHFFPFSKSQHINCQLEMLRKGPSRDVSQFIAKMTKQECSFAIKEWLAELLEEIAFLAERKKEAETELKEFRQRTEG
ncbi:MAG: ParB N-terminal domain-containing protein [Candidatus Bathyarchaeota archaeon]|nr:ParB N-terminal domain-containing protein [Candidatus Bathyarchaeota archaeon]